MEDFFRTSHNPRVEKTECYCCNETLEDPEVFVSLFPTSAVSNNSVCVLLQDCSYCEKCLATVCNDCMHECEGYRCTTTGCENCFLVVECQECKHWFCALCGGWNADYAPHITCQDCLDILKKASVE
jgi:hypothetical protein